MMSVFDPHRGSYSLGRVLLRRNTLYSCVSKGDFWNNFWLFYVDGYARLLRSILVLLFSLQAWKWPRSSSTQAVAFFFWFCYY